MNLHRNHFLPIRCTQIEIGPWGPIFSSPVGARKNPLGKLQQKNILWSGKKKFPHIFGNTEMVPKSFYFERFFSVIVLVLVATMSQQYSSKNKLMIRKYVSLNSQKHEKESFLLFYNNTNYYTKLKTKNPDYMLKWSL